MAFSPNLKFIKEFGYTFLFWKTWPGTVPNIPENIMICLKNVGIYEVISFNFIHIHFSSNMYAPWTSLHYHYCLLLLARTGDGCHKRGRTTAAAVLCFPGKTLNVAEVPFFDEENFLLQQQWHQADLQSLPELLMLVKRYPIPFCSKYFFEFNSYRYLG